MRLPLLLAAIGMYSLTGGCSDPTAEIEQGKVSRATTEVNDEDEHTESLEASVDNEVTENLKVLKEEEARRKAAAASTQGSKTPATDSKTTTAKDEPTTSDETAAKDEPAPTPEPEQRPEEYLSIVQVVPGETAFTLGSSADFAAMPEIAAKNKINVNVTCEGNYPCPLNLSVEKTAWDALDVAGALRATVTPAKVSIPAGETMMVTISVNVGTTAPAMEGQHMNLLISSDDAEQKKLYSQEIKFSVKAQMDVYMLGGMVAGDKGEIWSTGQPDRNARTTMEFKQPTQVNIYVKDPSGTAHIMHGAGDIPHQNTGQNPPPTIDNATPYTFMLQAGESGRIYCHDHETGALGQDLSVAAQ